MPAPRVQFKISVATVTVRISAANLTTLGSWNQGTDSNARHPYEPGEALIPLSLLQGAKSGHPSLARRLISTPLSPERNALHSVTFVAWQVPVCTLSAVRPAPVKTSSCSQNESPEFGRETIVAASCMTFKSHLLLILRFSETPVLEFELSLFAGFQGCSEIWIRKFWRFPDSVLNRKGLLSAPRQQEPEPEPG